MRVSFKYAFWHFFTTATLTWFDDGCCDVKYLDEWLNAPLNYHSSQATTPDWHIDHHEKIIAYDENGRLFHHAADLLMRYQFYPSHIMSHVSTFSLNNRWLEIGDRIVQRIHLLGINGRSLLDTITMTQITQTIVEPHRCGFTYTTVATHVEQGEWSLTLTWRPDGNLVLNLDSVSRPNPQEPRRNYPFMRAFQKAAHLQGISHFQQMVTAVSP